MIGLHLASDGFLRRPLLRPGLLRLPLLRAQVTTLSTALDPDGVTWREFGADVPRFHGTARRLRIGGQRSNPIVHVRTVGGTGWTPSNMTAVGTVADPAGVAGAVEVLDEGTGTGSHRTTHANFSLTATTDDLWTLSALVRPITADTWVQGAVGGSNNRFSATVAWANFHLSGDGAIGSVGAGTTATIVRVGQWYRITLTFPATSSGATVAQQVFFGTAPNGTLSRAASFTGSGRQVAIAWPQFELGAFASLPILPPPGSPGAATRGADLIAPTLASLGIPASGDCAMVFDLMIPQAAPAGVNQTILMLDDGTADNRFVLHNPAGGATIVPFRTTSGGVASGGSAGTFTPGTQFKVATCIKAGRIAASVAGGAVAAATGGPTSGLTTGRIGNNLTANGSLFGEIAAIDLLPPVPDGVLRALSAGAM